LAYNLAVEISPEYPGSSSSADFREVARIAGVSKLAIQRQSTPAVPASTDIFALTRESRGNILSGP
jgi:hypothetical protein